MSISIWDTSSPYVQWSSARVLWLTSRQANIARDVSFRVTDGHRPQNTLQALSIGSCPPGPHSRNSRCRGQSQTRSPGHHRARRFADPKASSQCLASASPARSVSWIVWLLFGRFVKTCFDVTPVVKNRGDPSLIDTAPQTHDRSCPFT